MQYFGGKQRIAKQIASVLNPIIARYGAYVEPFVGGASMMAATSAIVRTGGDANVALITMWRALCDGWIPPTIVTEEMYKQINETRDDNDPMTAFVGFGCSFAGKWFGGYARGGMNRNYAANAASSIRKKLTNLRDVRWYAGDYRTCPIDYPSVIYCDPPYTGTTQYAATESFDWDVFWDWCLARHHDGHAVFVSEYTAPPTFQKIREITTKTDIRCATGKETRRECLFCPSDSPYYQSNAE